MKKKIDIEIFNIEIFDNITFNTPKYSYSCNPMFLAKFKLFAWVKPNDRSNKSGILNINKKKFRIKNKIIILCVFIYFILMSKILFIPVYNCKIQIKRLIEKIKKKNLESFNEILFVDNISSDGTLETIIEETANLIKKITIIRNDNNYGLGGSHKVALNYALNNNYKDLVVFHGDDQGNVDDLEKIISLDIERNYEFILGSRFMRKSVLNNYSFIRIAGNIFFNFIFSLITFKKLSDLGSGLNLIRLDNLDIDQIKSFPDNLTFNYYLILYICHFKKNFLFVPITWSETDQISNVKYFNHIIQMCSIILNFLMSKKNFFKKRNNKYTWRVIKN